MRCVVATVLIFVLVLTGAGRGVVLADSEPMSTVVIDGVAITICHTDVGDQSGVPGDHQHDCCDACTLMAPTLLPEPPALSSRVVLAYFVAHSDAMAWVPTISRVRTPRQSQGPPRTA